MSKTIRPVAPVTAAPAAEGRGLVSFVLGCACACVLGASSVSAQGASDQAPGRNRELPVAPRLADAAAQPAVPSHAAPAARFSTTYRAPGSQRPVLTVPGFVRAPLPLAGAGRAFAQELREETLRSRRAGVFAAIPPELPELLEDDFISRQRSQVAESVLGSAIEAAFDEVLIGDVRRKHGLRVTPSITQVAIRSGVKLDATPSWTWRRTTPGTGVRVDVPLAPTSSFRVHAWKDLKGGDRTPLRMGGAFNVDPFDESVSAGLSFEF